MSLGKHFRPKTEIRMCLHRALLISASDCGKEHSHNFFQVVFPGGRRKQAVCFLLIKSDIRDVHFTC